MNRAILELVCGLPSPRRGRRQIMALQAYIDDSGAPPNEKVLVLGGYVAKAEQWSSFSDQWEAALKMSPGLQYFKMAEAVKKRGQFHRFSCEERDARLRVLHGIIEDHALCFVAAVVPFADFDAALRTLPFKLPFRPYMAAFMGLMSCARTYGQEIGINERVDFIFDEQAMEKTILLQNWDFAAASVLPEERAFVSKTPIFRPSKVSEIYKADEIFLPLQAADFIAWLQRNSWECERGISEPYIPPWTPQKPINGQTYIFDEASITQVLARAYAAAKAESEGGAA